MNVLQLVLLPLLVVVASSAGAVPLAGCGVGVLPAVGLLLPVAVAGVAGGGGGAGGLGVAGVGVVALVPPVVAGSVGPILLGGGVVAEGVVVLVAVVLEALPVVTASVLVVEPFLVDLLVMVAVAHALLLRLLLPQVLVELGPGLVLVPLASGVGAGGVVLVGGLGALAGPVGEALVIGGGLVVAVEALHAVVEPLVPGVGGLGVVLGSGALSLTQPQLGSLIPGLGGVSGSAALGVSDSAVGLVVAGLGGVASGSGQTVGVHVVAVSAASASESLGVALVAAIGGGQVLVDVAGGLAGVVPLAVGSLRLVQLLRKVLGVAVGAGGVGAVASELVPAGVSGSGVLGPGRLPVGLLGVSGGGPGGVLVDVAVVGGGAVPDIVQSVGVLAVREDEATVLRVPQVELLVVGVVNVVVVAATLRPENGAK